MPSDDRTDPEIVSPQDPVADEAVPIEATEEDAAEAEGGGIERILFVEDEIDIQEVTQLALEAIGGFTVEICSSGREALEKAPAFAPDAILLDVMMPDMDGPSTLVGLRDLPETADTPVIFMTAKTQAHEIQHFKDLGALDVITKPFDPITLADQIRTILERKAEDDVA